MSESDEVLDPFVTEIEDKGTVLAERLETLSDARIALFSNTKKNSDYFLEGLGSRLEVDHDAQISEVMAKEVATSSASDSDYATLSNYDAVLTAYGDCGSCSSWTMYDAFQLEDRGIPTVVFCTEEFTTLCQYEAENQGIPGLPIVEIEHPIADIEPEKVTTDRVTDKIVENVVEALTAEPEKLVKLYQGRYTDVGGDAIDD